MIKYVVNKNTPHVLKLDTDNTDNINVMDCEWCIDYMYYIEESGVFVIDGQSFDVKEGDVIVKLYGIEDSRNKEYLIISHPQLADYMRRKKIYENSRSKKDISKSCEECDCCKAN